MTEITQADREAAAVFYGTWGGTKGWSHLEEPIREGIVDDNALVQAFARHRIKAKEALSAEIERLREALEKIQAGSYPRPLGKPWRMGASSSKHDRCIHNAWMYETCEGCLDAFVSQALANMEQADD